MWFVCTSHFVVTTDVVENMLVELASTSKSLTVTADVVEGILEELATGVLVPVRLVVSPRAKGSVRCMGDDPSAIELAFRVTDSASGTAQCFVVVVEELRRVVGKVESIHCVPGDMVSCVGAGRLMVITPWFSWASKA